jgi:hypothetical protein
VVAFFDCRNKQWFLNLSKYQISITDPQNRIRVTAAALTGIAAVFS